MVQRKVTKKPKTKSEPAAVMKNGYSKSQSKKNPKIKEKEASEISETANETPLSDIKETNENTVQKNSKIVKSSKVAKAILVPGTSKDLSENGLQEEISKNKSQEEAESDKEQSVKRKGVNSSSKKSPQDVPKKVLKSDETAPSDEGKSRKRKMVSKEEENPKVNDKKTSILTKSKAKKQKMVMSVPPLSSISGKVFVFGENDVGQLGLDEDVDAQERPFLLNLPHSIIDVAAGGMHSVCLTESGDVITFGCNDEGALGRVASEEEERIPRRVEIPEKIVQVSAGDSHSAALAESGQVYLWGNFRNGEGQMGLMPDGQKRIAPVKVLTEQTIVKIASGGDHLACLSNEGMVFTCGCAEQGQLGRINPRSCKDGGRRKGLASLLEPEAVILKPKKAFTDIWTESYATFLKTHETGSIYAFGLNNYNQLGLENINSDQENQMIFFPKHVTSFNNRRWQQVNGGQHHTLALDDNGLVHALGRSDYGRLGLGENSADQSAPTVVPALEKEKCNSVSCGNCVSFAVTEQGSIYSWGMGSSQLGHGSRENESDIFTPRLIRGDKEELLNSWEVLKVSGGGQHALLLACPKKVSNKDKKA